MDLDFPHQARDLRDLIDNAKPEQFATFNDEGDFKGIRQAPPAMYSVSIDSPIVTLEQFRSSRFARSTEILTTTNTGDLANAKPLNMVTWRHLIVNANVLNRAGMSIDPSGMFEGTPFIPGFDSQVAIEWLGENAEIPENSPSVVKFPYEIHTIGTFTIVSRRLLKLVPNFLDELQIAQANAIREQVEIAFLNGDSANNANQPDGLVKRVSNVQDGTGLNGRTIMSNVMLDLELAGLDMSEVSVVMSPDVAKKIRTETNLAAFPTLEPSRLLVSKHMPSETLIAGRYSDYQGITGNKIEFLAHTYTPEGIPETGSSRVRSMFDVDSLVLNQDSFVKVENIA